MQNSFSLLEGKDTLVVEINDCDPQTNEPKLIKGEPKKLIIVKYILRRIVKKIYEDFLTVIPKHGQLITRARRKAFDARIAWFESRLKAFEKGVRERLEKEIDKSIEELSIILLEGVRKHPPARYLKF